MTTILRSIGAIAAGVAVTGVLVIAVELLSAIVHPVPESFRGTFEDMCQHVERYPQWVLATAVVVWGFTAFAGTWTAGRLGNRGCALFLGLLLLSALILNISMLPYPVWFKIASPIVIMLTIVCGYRWPSRRASAADDVTYGSERRHSPLKEVS